MIMRKVEQAYFSNIANLVNDHEYNCHSAYHYEKAISINDVFKQDSYFRLKSELAEQGFLVIEFADYPRHQLSDIETWLKNLLGAPFVNNNPGKLMHAKVQAMDNAKYYVNSNLAQPIHTDEGYTNRYPRYVVLYCLQQAESGGDSIVVQVNPLYINLIHHFGEQVRLLFEKNSVIVKHAYGIEEKPILFWLENDTVGMSYSPVLQKMLCSDKVFELFDFITKYIHDRHHQIRFKLQSGQALLLDNCRVLHGRTAFAKEHGRLLYRYWFNECLL